MVTLLIYCAIVIMIIVALLKRKMENNPGKFLDYMKKLEDEREELENKKKK
ncbi:MAG: hypothetical protein NTX05_01105 [Fusobacteria bacterium]|nr:hypothetical protein [Fusobacteriota bacterium]